jgi:uncharacterized membrane protein
MILDAFTSLASAWGEYYGDHALLRTAVTYAHVGGLLVSGGLALANDRIILRTREAPLAERTLRLHDLHRLHRTVVGGLAVVAASGVAMFLADLETYSGAWLFWCKMGLVALLLGNGLAVVRAERALGQDPESAPGWGRLRRTAAVSTVLWLLIALLGTALVNVA